MHLFEILLCLTFRNIVPKRRIPYEPSTGLHAIFVPLNIRWGSGWGNPSNKETGSQYQMEIVLLNGGDKRVSRWSPVWSDLRSRTSTHVTMNNVPRHIRLSRSHLESTDVRWMPRNQTTRLRLKTHTKSRVAKRCLVSVLMSVSMQGKTMANIFQMQTNVVYNR